MTIILAEVLLRK